jgi:hypothetical protein
MPWLVDLKALASNRQEPLFDLLIKKGILFYKILASTMQNP